MLEGLVIIMDVGIQDWLVKMWCQDQYMSDAFPYSPPSTYV